ncbi:MAG: EAL domain-containing protein [Gemmatimonadota bacterium]
MPVSPPVCAPDPRDLLRSLGDAVVVLDSGNAVVFATPAIERLTGWHPEQLRGRVAPGLVHPDDRAEAQKRLDATRQGTALRPFEVRIATAREGWIRAEIHARPISLPDGSSSLAFVVRDMRGREDVHAELRRERNYLRSLVEQIEVGIVACDADGTIAFYNGAFEEQHEIPLGRHAEEWIHSFTFYDVDGVTPLPAEQAPLARAFRGDSVRNYEYTVLGKGGELRYRRANGTQLRDGTGQVLGAVVALHDITDQRRAEEALRRQALHDPLTGLPNRALLLDRLGNALARARRNQDNIALLFLDLDNFKVVNDGLGHSVGDRLLVTLAARLEEFLRVGDTVARLGGDEFVVLCESVQDLDEVEGIVSRLRAVLSSPVLIDGNEVHPTVSVGIAWASAADTPETLLRDADTAMYVAKEAGRNRHAVFDEQLRQRAVRRMEAETLLVRALENDALRILFQPIIDVHTGSLVGAEALVRCLDPDLGLVAPSEFIPVAESMGLVTHIDEWMLDQACAHARLWADEWPESRLFVSCNVSARLIDHDDLTGMVERALNRHGLDAERLWLEMTETTFIRASAQTRAGLERILERGTAVGIDDFGTGYSSLTYLRDLPVSFLKIDRTFVAGLGERQGDTAIVEAVVRLAHALGLSVTAEGVETREQAERLRHLGCDHVQGYHYAGPLTGEAFRMRARASAEDLPIDATADPGDA